MSPRLGLEMAGHAPADYTATPAIDEGQIDTRTPAMWAHACPRGPKRLRLGCCDLTLRQVVTDLGLLVASRGFDAPMAADASRLGDAHGPTHTVATTPRTVLIGDDGGRCCRAY